MPIISLSYYSTLQISENGLSISAISCMRKYTYTQDINYKNKSQFAPCEIHYFLEVNFKGIVLDGFGIARGL